MFKSVCNGKRFEGSQGTSSKYFDLFVGFFYMFLLFFIFVRFIAEPSDSWQFNVMNYEHKRSTVKMKCSLKTCIHKSFFGLLFVLHLLASFSLVHFSIFVIFSVTCFIWSAKWRKFTSDPLPSVDFMCH